MKSLGEFGGMKTKNKKKKKRERERVYVYVKEVFMRL